MGVPGKSPAANWEERMRKALLLVAAGAMVALAGPAMAQKKTLAVVVKGLDNGFFTVMELRGGTRRQD